MRLFIGISIPERLKKHVFLLSEELQQVFPGKYVTEDTYHITMAYIGECDDTMREKAIAAMADCAALHSSVQISIDSPAYFGKTDKAILHLRADSAGNLQPISADLRSRLSSSELPFDSKPLVPHITLARKVCVDSRLDKINYGHKTFTAAGLTLFHSCRVDDILRYIPIHFEPFTGERSPSE